MTKTKSVITTLRPEEAKQLVDTCQFSRQRKLKMERIDYLAREMTRSRFIPGVQIYFGVLPSGQRLLLNGQHTLHAIVKSDLPLVCTITEHEVADEDEAGLIYAVFDIHRVRTWGDSLAAISPEANNEFTRRSIPAVGIVQAGMRLQHGKQVEISRPVRIAAVDEYIDELNNLHNLALEKGTNETRKFFIRASVLATAVVTLKYQPSAATEFWAAFLSDVGLRAGAPERALLQYFRNTRLASSGSGARRTFLYAAAAAWNASFRGDDLKIVQPNKLLSYYLLGTPFQEGRRGAVTEDRADGSLPLMEI